MKRYEIDFNRFMYECPEGNWVPYREAQDLQQQLNSKEDALSGALRMVEILCKQCALSKNY